MTRPLPLSYALLTTLVALGSGCGRSVSVDHWIAPEADIGGARSLAITDAYGRDSSVLAVTDIALDTAAQSPWFVDVFTASRLETDGREVWLRDGRNLAAQTLYARLDVLEDNAVVVTQEHPDGTYSETLSAHTLLALTVADARGLIVDEREIEGVHERSGPVSPWDIDESLALSAGAAVNSALATITPRPASSDVRLDDRDGRVNELLDLHFATDRDDPDRLTRDEVARKLAKLDGAPALWNRAALLESVDERALAMPLYERALAHDDAADWYREEHDAALARAAAAQTLGLQ